MEQMRLEKMDYMAREEDFLNIFSFDFMYVL